MITLPSEIATSAGMFVFAIVQALILLVLAPVSYTHLTLPTIA